MVEYKMEKVMELNKEQFELLSKDGETKEIKKILGIPSDRNYAIGDSMVATNMNTNPNDVLKMTWNDRDIYYVVIKPIDEQRAFCFTIYPN